MYGFRPKHLEIVIYLPFSLLMTENILCTLLTSVWRGVELTVFKIIKFSTLLIIAR